MFDLPMDLQIKIYEYDSTYKDIFSKVLKELHKVYNFWYLHFYNSELSAEMSTQKELTFIQAKHLCNYWNFDFLNQTYTLSYERYQNNNPGKGFCEIMHRSDNENIKNYFILLKTNIECHKFLNKKNISY
jgi:hypothetical protein